MARRRACGPPSPGRHSNFVGMRSTIQLTLAGCSRSHEAAIGNQIGEVGTGTGEMNMVEKIIVAIFKDQGSASRAATAIKDLKDTGASKIKLKAGVMVQKDDQGTVSVLEEHANPLHGTKIGASVGALIGLIAGPLVASLGAAIGAGAGLIGDAVKWGLNSTFVNSVTSDMRPGTTALIVEADESDPREVNDIVAVGEGRVYRQPLHGGG